MEVGDGAGIFSGGHVEMPTDLGSASTSLKVGIAHPMGDLYH